MRYCFTGSTSFRSRQASASTAATWPRGWQQQVMRFVCSPRRLTTRSGRSARATPLGATRKSSGTGSAVAHARVGAEAPHWRDEGVASRRLRAAFHSHADAAFVLATRRDAGGGACICLCASRVACRRLCGAKAWLHVQDFEVDTAFRLGLPKGRVLRRVVTAFERWILRRFDRVSTISARMLERLHVKGVQPDRVVHFPNWVDVNTISPLAGSNAYRAELGIARDAVVAMYSGSMAGKQGLDLLPEAARELGVSYRISCSCCAAMGWSSAPSRLNALICTMCVCCRCSRSSDWGSC